MESRASRFSTPRLIVIGLALAAVVIAAILLIPRRTAADDPRYAQARRDMVSDLRGLAMMEASLHRVTGKYTDNPTQAGQVSTVGVNPPTVALADSGWAAVITHQRATGFRCGIGVYTKNPLSRWAKSGEIVCK